MVLLDFKQDWKEYIIGEMSDLGFQYNQSKSLEENTITYFNFKRRILGNHSRKVYESKELYISPQYANKYKKIKEVIIGGGNLRPYLSHQIRKIGKIPNVEDNDYQLNDWGITHLHFDAKGTNDVLFVMFTDTEAYIIQMFPHNKRDNPYIWVDKRLIEILHNNWPKIIENYKTVISDENLTSEQRKTIRKYHDNMTVTVSDGTNYLPTGGGMVLSGRCFNDIIHNDELMNKLKKLEGFVKLNENNFREAMNISMDEKLSIKLIIDDMRCWLYEPDKRIRFNLNLSDTNR